MTFVELAIFGSKDPDIIASYVEKFCKEHLGTKPRACILWRASIGVAAGLSFANGRRVLLKCHQSNVSRESLLAIERVRRFLQEKSFPCPAIILGARPLANGSATVEAFIDAPPAIDGFIPEQRRLLAQGLAHMVNLLQGKQEALGGYLLTRKKMDTLWPTPHSKLFDFEATKRGAEWRAAAQERCCKDTERSS